MPDLKLGLNDKLTLGQDGGGGAAAHGGDARSAKAIELDDLTFHQCVNLSRFHTDRCVNFVPPDGEFELMRYRISEAVQLPFKVLPIITVRAPLPSPHPSPHPSSPSPPLYRLKRRRPPPPVQQHARTLTENTRVRVWGCAVWTGARAVACRVPSEDQVHLRRQAHRAGCDRAHPCAQAHGQGSHQHQHRQGQVQRVRKLHRVEGDSRLRMRRVSPFTALPVHQTGPKLHRLAAVTHSRLRHAVVCMCVK
jgi:hypothetical protein